MGIQETQKVKIIEGDPEVGDNEAENSSAVLAYRTAFNVLGNHVKKFHGGQIVPDCVSCEHYDGLYNEAAKSLPQGNYQLHPNGHENLPLDK